MANQQRRISYGIDFEVNDAELKKLKKQLEQLKKLSVTNYASQQGIGLNNPAIAEKQANDLTRLKKDAAEFQRLMRLAYNPKTNSYNITKFNKILSQSNLEVKHFRAEMQKTVEGRAVWAAQTHELTKFNTEIKQSHKILDSLGKTLANTIKWTISSSLMQGVTRSISQAYGFAKNLDGALNDIRIVTGKSADEMARFAERANAVASNLGKGTNDYTRAALIYAQQGLGQKEIEEKTASTLKTTNVTGQSAEEVSEELTAVWNGYKVSAEQAELYVDRLAAVASTTASNLQELSIGMSKVASAAATLGVGEDQLAAQLSTIISVTRQAPETVGTALRTVYARITDIQAGLDEDGVTLGKYSGDMAKIGINVLDLNGNLRNMGEVMEEIGNKWSIMTQEQKIYLAQTMAGQRQYSNLMALFDNFDKYESALKTAQNAEGKLQEQQDVYMDRLSTHVQQLTTAIEHMWMGLVDTNGFKDVIDGLTTIVEKVDKLFQSIGGGKNLLQSLIPIVMSLTSKTVASGINTMIMNSQLEKRQLRDQRSSQVLAQKEMKDLQREGQQGSQRYQIFKQKSEFLQAAPGTFSAQQMGEINQRWAGSLEAAAEADKRKTELNQYSDITRSITTTLGNNAVDLKETLSIEDLENAIIDVGGQYDELSIRIERYAQDQDEINKQQDAAQQQLTEAYLQTATKIKSAKVFSEENSQFKQLNSKNLKKYESAQAQIVSQKQQELDSLSGRFLGLPTTKNNTIQQLPLRGIFNVIQNEKITSPQMQSIENTAGFEGISAIGDQKEKIKKIKEILENSIYKEIFDTIPPDQIKVENFIKEVQNKFAEIEQLKINAQKAIQQASEKQKAANQELLQRQQMQNVYQRGVQALKNNLQIQNVDKFQNNLKFLSQDFSSITIPPELKTQLENTKKEYQELSQAITDYNQKVQSSSKLSQEQINALRQEKEALEQKQQTLLNTTQGIVNNINANVQNKGQQAIDGLKYSGAIINNNQEAIKDTEADANRQKQLQGIMSTLTGVNMLTAAYSNLGNAIKGAFYEGNWEGFIGTMLTSLPMLIAGITQLSTGFTALNSILSFDIGLSLAQAKAKKKQQKEHRNLIKTQLMELQTFRNLNRVQQEAIITSKLEGSTKAGKAGVEGLTGAFSGLKTVIAEAGILLIPLVVAIAGLMAFKAVGDNRVKQAEAQLQANKKVIESENEKQNQIKKEQSVRKQVEALNEQYKKGIITRAELRDKTRELQQKYKDESKQIQKLIKDYKNLGTAAEQAKKKEANDLEKSTRTEHDTAANSLDRKMETMHVRVGLGNWTGEWDAKAKGQASIGGGGFGDSETIKLGQRLEAVGLGTFDQWGNTIKLKNAANGAQAYQQLKILQDFVNDSSVDKNSEAYKGAKEILDSMKQEMEQYESTIDQHMQAIAQQVVTNTDISFEEVNSLKQYNQKYEELAQQMKSQMRIYYPDKTQEEINDVVDKVLAANIDTKLQDKFADKNEAIKKLENNKNLGKVSDEIKNKIEALDENQLDVFLRNNLETATSYTVIENALDKISQMDLSNINPLTSSESIQKAAEAYERIKEAIEAIQNGKSISNSTKKKIIQEGLISQEDWDRVFSQNINGSWTLKDDATIKQGANILTQSVLENQRKGYNKNKKDFEGYQIWNKATEGMNKQYDFSSEDSMVKHNRSSTRFYSLVDNASKLNELRSKINNAQDFGEEYSEALIEEDNTKTAFNTDLSILMKNKELALQSMTQKQYNKWKSLYDKGDIDTILKEIIKNEQGNLWISEEDLQKIKDEGTNEDKALKMIEAMKSANNAEDFVSLSSWEELINQGKLNQATFKQISEKYDDYIKTYSAIDIDEIQSKMQEYAQRMYDFEFPTDVDVDAKAVKLLGEHYQETVEQSGLFDKALISNAKNAKDTAEQILRFQVVIDKVLKNYGTWKDTLLNGTDSEIINILPQLENIYGDLLDIHGDQLPEDFLTNADNLDLLRQVLYGTDQQAQNAYDSLSKLAQLKIFEKSGVDIETATSGLEELLSNDYIINLLNGEQGFQLSEEHKEKFKQDLSEYVKETGLAAAQMQALLKLSGIQVDLEIIDGEVQFLDEIAKSISVSTKREQADLRKIENDEREKIKNQKELTKYLKDERDIYHQINRLLNDQERTVKRITRNQQDMYGTELLDNLNAESAEYEKQQKLLKSKQKLQQQDLANKKAELASKGASFDANGNISNYNNLIGSAMNNVNSIISRERGVQEAMNQHLLSGGNTGDEIYKDLDAQLSSIGRKKSQANDYLNDLKTDLSNYEKVKDQAEDVADQLTELSEKQIEINLKKFNMKLEVTLDLSQATKTWNDYKRNVLQHDDIFNPNRALSAQKDNAQRLADINADSQSLNIVNKQIAEAMADNGTLYKTQGQKKKAIEELQKKAIQLRKGILENEDAIKQTYLEQYDIISEMFEKQKSQYDFVNNQLEHNKNMMSLVYGENDYAAQNVYNDKMIENNLKSIESMNNRIQIAEENLRKARESGNTAIIEKAEAEWQTAIQNRNQLEEQSAQLMKDRYTAAINQIAHQMEQKLTNNKGFNYMDTEWDLMKKQSNLYLDDVNSAFAVKNTEYLYNQALNDTKGLKSQQQLKKVMSEQLDILKEKDKLTQYDVDRAQKVLEVEKARIALEQARNNKTQMRLKRDSQGNYSYQYVADQDNIAKAENDLANAENDLYNFDKDNYENKLKEAYDATKEYQEKIKALNEEYINATEERRKQIDEEKRLLDQQYSEYILNLSQETEWGKQNLMQSTMISFSDMMNQEQIDFENMSDAQKEKWLGDMVPSINSGIAEMIGKFSTNPDSFKQIVVEATQSMDNERQTYQKGLAELQTAAGQNWNKIKQAMDPVVELQNELIIDNDRLKDQAGEIVDAMNGTLDALTTQADKWQAVYDKTDAAVLRVYDYIKAIDKAALKKLNQNNSSSNRSSNTQTIPTINPLTIPTVNPDNFLSQKNNNNPTGKELKEKEKNLQYLEQQFKIIKENTKGIYYDGKHEKLKDTYAYDYTVVASKRGMSFAANLVDLAKDFKYWAQHAGLAADTTNTALRYGADKNFIPILSKMTGVKFDTGGYTGDWSSTQGKLAILHQKELVLNKEDTANMLEMIQMVREMQQNELQFRMASLNNELNDLMKQNSQIEKIKSQQDMLEQSVSITANFPSVNSKKEIEQAFKDLTNKAMQIALK